MRLDAVTLAIAALKGHVTVDGAFEWCRMLLRAHEAWPVLKKSV